MGGLWMPHVEEEHFTLAERAQAVRRVVQHQTTRCLTEERQQAHRQVRLFAERARARLSHLGFRSWEECAP